MKKEEIIEKVEKMIFDLNYMINTDKTDDKKQYAWKYARGYLELVIKMLKD